MAYQFVFRELIYHDMMYNPIEDLMLLDPYEVPDYLSYSDFTTRGDSTAFKYISKLYDTLEQAMSDFHDVMVDSGISSEPHFYNNHDYMCNATELYRNYINKR